jgi:four helix bundle protein
VPSSGLILIWNYGILFSLTVAGSIYSSAKVWKCESAKVEPLKREKMDNRDFKINLEKRTKAFAIAIVKFCVYLRKLGIPEPLLNQSLKAGTSIGANYREANRAESKKDFIHKIAIVEKETAEMEFWLEVIDESHILDNEGRTLLKPLLRESKELVALFTAISKSSKQKV